MHRITISSGPCGKLGSTEWGVQELKVGETPFEFSGFYYYFTLNFILPSVCILPLVCSLQSAFYTDRIVFLFVYSFENLLHVHDLHVQ